MSSLPQDEIAEVQYYILGSDEIRLESSVDVVNKELFRNEKPCSGGIYDAHMGTTDYGWLCETCGATKQTCPGHPGSLELRYPVKNAFFADTIFKYLKVICATCGKLVVKRKLKVSKGNLPKSRFLAEYAKISKVDKCEWCGAPHYNVIKTKGERSTLQVEIPQSHGIERKELLNHDIAAILQRVSDATVKRLGKSPLVHPRKLILSTIKVPPNTIRPDIRRAGANRQSSNDVTTCIKTLVEINNSLPEEIPNYDRIQNELRERYFNLDTTFHTMVRGSGTANQVKIVSVSNKALSSIAERIPDKSGRIKKNIFGKRVWYMGRSVITGDDTMKVNQLGLPMSNARTISIKETVRPYNRERLLRHYINGRAVYPGCTGVWKASNKKFYNIDFMDRSYVLQDGDVVHRDLVTGDVVNFNRQPTLDFASITSMSIVVLENIKTFTFNVTSTNLFHADFDGDNMNIQFSSDCMPRIEMQMLSTPLNWFVSYKDSSPKLGCVHDAIIGMTQLSKHDTKFNKYKAMTLFANVDQQVDFSKVSKTGTILGRELISMLLPSLNLRRKPAFYMPQYDKVLDYHPEDIELIIEDGQIKQGILDSATIGSGKHGSIFHIVNNEYGPKMAIELIHAFQQMSSTYFYYAGFSAGLCDIDLKPEALKRIKQATEGIFLESTRITERMQRGELVAPLGISLNEFYEMEQINALASGDEFLMPVLSSMDLKTNNMLRLVLSGAKGNMSNLVQINAAQGLQLVASRRASKNFGWERTSPYFRRYETDPRAHGYISTSFKEGTQPDVFPFAAAESRFGMIAQALLTAHTGYMNRLCVKNLESLIINNRYSSVKHKNIIQLLYAENGFDTRRIERVQFATVALSSNDFERLYHLKAWGDYNNPKVQAILDQEFETLSEDRQLYRDIMLRLEETFVGCMLFGDQLLMPVNVERVMGLCAKEHPNGTLDPVRCIEMTKKLIEDLPYVYYNQFQESRRRPYPKNIQSALTLLIIYIRGALCTANLRKFGITTKALEVCQNRIKHIIQRALIDPGKAAGSIAAQCICEPMTQYLLDSRHRSGGGGSTKTDSIQRISEIINVKSTQKMQNPSMLIRLKPELEEDRLTVKNVANRIEITRFETFVLASQLFFESYGEPEHSRFKHEVSMIKKFEQLNKGLVPSDLTKWCIRFELDHEQLIFKGMLYDSIIIALRRGYPSIYWVYTPESSEQLILRGYLKSNALKTSSEKEALALLKDIQKLVVRGIDGITSASLNEVAVSYVDPDDQQIKTKKVYAIETSGSNLVGVLGEAESLGIHSAQTDSIQEYEHMFGIAAARDKVIHELIKTMSGTSRSLSTLIADEMSFTGTLTGFTRAGLQAREKDNISLRMGAQTPIQVLEAAASDAALEHVSGISGALINGSVPKLGTMYNSVVVNQPFVEKWWKTRSQEIEEAL